MAVGADSDPSDFLLLVMQQREVSRDYWESVDWCSASFFPFAFRGLCWSLSKSTVLVLLNGVFYCLHAGALQWGGYFTFIIYAVLLLWSYPVQSKRFESVCCLKLQRVKRSQRVT